MTTLSPPRRFSSTRVHGAIAAVMFLLQLYLTFGPTPRVPDTWGSAFMELAARSMAGAFSILGAIVLIPFVTILAWLYRAYRNLPVLVGEPVTWTPSWAAWAFIIPLVNLYAGYKVIEELWQCSAPDAGDGRWRRAPSPSLLPVWWACVIVSGFGGFHFSAWGEMSRGMFEFLAVLQTTMLIATAPAGLGAIWIVLAVDRRQTRRARQLGLQQ